MCGRYNIVSDIDKLQEIFEVAFEANLENVFRATSEQQNVNKASAGQIINYNIAPTQQVPVVYQTQAGVRACASMHWGLVPKWLKTPKPTLMPHNAKVETASEKPYFREAMQRRHCLIPVSGFYEWQQQTHGKQPYHITLRDSDIFAFAGLWEIRQSQLSCTILTTQPNTLMQTIHHRMPVILHKDQYASWLKPTTDRDSDSVSFFEPYPAEAMEAFPVSTLVNKVANNSPQLIEPIATLF